MYYFMQYRVVIAYYWGVFPEGGSRGMVLVGEVIPGREVGRCGWL